MLLKKSFWGYEKIFTEALVRRSENDVGGHMISPISNRTRSSYLLRLFGVLRERKPPFRHFDEKGFMLRTTSCLRQTNAFGRVLA
jgi:hypothetical protein